MRRLFEIGDRYAANSGWEDFALVKLCLCAMGVLIGLFVKPSYKKAAFLSALLVFAATYISLMERFIRFIVQDLKKRNN